MYADKVRLYLHVDAAHREIVTALQELSSFIPRYRGRQDRAEVLRVRRVLEGIRQLLDEVMRDL